MTIEYFQHYVVVTEYMTLMRFSRLLKLLNQQNDNSGVTLVSVAFVVVVVVGLFDVLLATE